MLIKRSVHFFALRHNAGEKSLVYVMFQLLLPHHGDL